MSIENRVNKQLMCGVAGAAIASLGLNSALAQTAVTNSQGDEPARLEKVTVTAEKRAQDVQDVPIAIAALTSEMLDERGIDEPQQLQAVVPGLSIGEVSLSSYTKVTLRGVGTETTGSKGDPGVPIHIDGYYVPSTAFMLRDMVDVERVEVLSGPQGTLYGRNAIGGAINIITNKPSPDREALLKLDVGNYNKRLIQGVLNGALADGVYGRIVVSDEVRDGYVENIGIGEDLSSSDYTSVRGSLLFDITENVDLLISAYDYKDDGQATYRWRTGTGLDPFVADINTPTNTLSEAKGISSTLTWGLGAFELRSVTAYNEDSSNVEDDIDQSSQLSSERRLQTNYESISEDLQLVSTDPGPFQWVVGAYYYSEDSEDIAQQFNDTGSATRTHFYVPYIGSAESYAAYGQGQVALGSKLEAIVGLRYNYDSKTWDSKTFGGPEGANLGLFISNVGSDSWGETTGKLGLNYHIADDVMVYGSWSRGYKSGGFETSTYDPETVDAYEVGAKSELFGGRLRLNGSAFLYDYKNKQDLQRVDLGNGVIRYRIVNASAAQISGAEVSFLARVTNGLTVDGSLGLLDAEFDRYVTADSFFPNSPIIDLAGNKLPYSPELKANLGLQYDWKLEGNNGQFSARVDGSWIDEQWSNAFNRPGDGINLLGDGDLLPAYSLINARFGWDSAGGDWSVDAYVNNVFDEAAKTYSFVTSAAIIRGEVYSSITAPRTFGVRVSKTFN